MFHIRINIIFIGKTPTPEPVKPKSPSPEPTKTKTPTSELNKPATPAPSPENRKIKAQTPEPIKSKTPRSIAPEQKSAPIEGSIHTKCFDLHSKDISFFQKFHIKSSFNRMLILK